MKPFVKFGDNHKMLEKILQQQIDGVTMAKCKHLDFDVSNEKKVEKNKSTKTKSMRKSRKLS